MLFEGRSSSATTVFLNASSLTSSLEPPQKASFYPEGRDPSLGSLGVPVDLSKWELAVWGTSVTFKLGIH